VIVVAFTIATIAKGTTAPANDSNAGQTSRGCKRLRQRIGQRLLSKAQKNQDDRTVVCELRLQFIVGSLRNLDAAQAG